MELPAQTVFHLTQQNCSSCEYYSRRSSGVRSDLYFIVSERENANKAEPQCRNIVRGDNSPELVANRYFWIPQISVIILGGFLFVCLFGWLVG